MAVKLVTSWKIFFQLAKAVGQARLKMSAQPTPENQVALDDAIDKLEAYRKICLTADEMTDFPDISTAALLAASPR